MELSDTATKEDGHMGRVVSIWRYPVKSMMGEELNASHVSERGLVGDRAYALVDQDTGKVASAKNPRRWGKLFEFRASFVEPPKRGAKIPAVRINLPDGRLVISGRPDADRILSQALDARVKLMTPTLEKPTYEEYWPDVEGASDGGKVTDELMPQRTFFDLATIHVLTTATTDRLRALFPEGRFDARRFRPNIVIEPYPLVSDFVENGWPGRVLHIGEDVRLRITKLCGRCVMTTLAQGDLPGDMGILRTASLHNHGKVGAYASVERTGDIRLGDRVWMD